MEPDQIKDLESLRVWLEPHSIQDACKVALRSALRVMPLAGDQMTGDWAARTGATALPLFRTLLTLAVACLAPTADVMEAAASAGRATLKMTADSVPPDGSMDAVVVAIGDAAQAFWASIPRHLLSDSIEIATRVVETRGANVGHYWRQVQTDAKLIDAPDNILFAPLWLTPIPDWFSVAEVATRAILLRDPQTWSFWLHWWDGVLSGNHLDWELQKAVALIPDAIWQQGPEAVARAIRDIEIDLAMRKTSNAEEIEPNPETGLLRLVPTSGLPEDIAAYTRRKIARTLALFDDPASAQLYGGLAADLRMLRQVAEDASNLPLELYDACASAGRRLAIRSANGECPPVEKDALLADYRARLGEIAADILSHDPMAQDVFERRNAITGNNALIEGAKIIEQAVMLIVPITEGHLTQALPRDAQLATDPESDPEDRKAASARLGGRFLRAAKWIGTAIARTVKIVDGTRKMLEAIPAIWDSPIFQHALGLFLKWLRL